MKENVNCMCSRYVYTALVKNIRHLINYYLTF